MKKKIITICLVIALAATAIVGASLAYFTDDHEQTNTFTAGKVGIDLDEVVVVDEPDEDGNLPGVDDGTRTSDGQSYKLFPGMTVDKDPTITVDSGSEDSWVAAKITVQGDVYDLLCQDKDQDWKGLELKKIVSGGLMADTTGKTENWNGLYGWSTANSFTYQDATAAENKTWVFYVFMKNIQEAGDEIVLFEQLKINPAYGNDEMAKLNNASVTVKAFAVQSVGFGNCYDAMTTAFPTDFSFGGEE